MLFSINPDSGGEMVPSVAMILIIAGIGLHVICNIVFYVTYMIWIRNRDAYFILWRMENKFPSYFIPGVSLVVSFHLVRMFYSNFFG
jgi:hypothetical protein